MRIAALRMAAIQDAKEILGIYQLHIEAAVMTFETEKPAPLLSAHELEAASKRLREKVRF